MSKLVKNTYYLQNFGFGTAAIGRPHYINIKEQSNGDFHMDTFKKEGIQMLQKAYDSGLRYFDTAPGYGIAEQMLQEWVTDFKPKDISIATKWGYRYTANFSIKAEKHEVKDLSIDHLKRQWKESQKLLPHLRVYQIHSATLESGVLDDKKVLDELQSLKEHHGLKIGLTASGPNQADTVKKAIKVAPHLFEVFQLTFNILERSVENISLELLRQGKQVVIKEGLANGRLLFLKKYDHYKALDQKLQSIAYHHDVDKDAVAFAYCQQKLKGASVLLGPNQENHLKSNLEAYNLVLKEKEIEALDIHVTSSDFYWNERKNLNWN